MTTITNYQVADVAGVGNLTFYWRPENFSKAFLLAMYVTGIARETVQNIQYHSDAIMNMFESGSGVPIMPVAREDPDNPSPVAVNGTGLYCNSYAPWRGRLELNPAFGYGFSATIKPTILITVPGNWDFLLTMHWQVEFEQ